MECTYHTVLLMGRPQSDPQDENTVHRPELSLTEEKWSLAPSPWPSKPFHKVRNFHCHEQRVCQCDPESRLGSERLALPEGKTPGPGGCRPWPRTAASDERDLSAPAGMARRSALTHAPKGYGSDPRSGCVQEAVDQCLSLSVSPPPAPSSLKSI